jgi:hypothetical protein
MAMQAGEIYRCTNNDCSCEIEVTKGAGRGGGEEAPRCCCGMPMELSYGGHSRSEKGAMPAPEATPF